MSAAQRPHRGKHKKPAGPRCNEQIRCPEVRLIGPGGEQLGIVKTREALQVAEGHGLDLVEVAPKAEPPVCKIADYGKLRYQQEKAEKAQRKGRQRDAHQLRLRPNIADHDLEVKIKAMEKFLAAGDQVRVSVQLRGRMQQHPELATGLLERILERFEGQLQVIHPIRHEGAQAQMTVGPKRK